MSDTKPNVVFTLFKRLLATVIVSPALPPSLLSLFILGTDGDD